MKAKEVKMDGIEQMLNIPTISDTTNFWMVRTKRGFFFDEFLKEEYIAIGWNLVRKAMISDELSLLNQGAENFLKKYI